MHIVASGYVYDGHTALAHQGNCAFTTVCLLQNGTILDCQPLAIGGDRLVAVYTHRRDPPGIALSISDDYGKTWDRAQDLMVYDSTAGTESGATDTLNRSSAVSGPVLFSLT